MFSDLREQEIFELIAEYRQKQIVLEHYISTAESIPESSPDYSEVTPSVVERPVS